METIIFSNCFVLSPPSSKRCDFNYYLVLYRISQVRLGKHSEVYEVGYCVVLWKGGVSIEDLTMTDQLMYRWSLMGTGCRWFA